MGNIVREYLPQPEHDHDPLPPIPTTPNDWLGLKKFLNAIRSELTKKPDADSIPTTPVNLTITQLTNGNLLQWNTDPMTVAYYVVYRNTTQDIISAQDVGRVHVGPTRSATFFDNKKSSASATPVTYWVYPYSVNPYSVNPVQGNPALILGTIW